jgi:hypothetical protein|tara:strand:- start:790 stop:1134 length:345 start_codon:yes stop_codon:yes gene_type:complete
MAISYTWDVSQCDVYPQKSGKSNVVHAVNWKLTATDDAHQDKDGVDISSTVISVQNIDTSDLSSFINWSDLTASDVQGWVETAMGSTEVARLKSSLDGMITQQISPSSVTKTLT